MAKTKITPDAEEPSSTTALATTEAPAAELAHYNPDQYDDTSRDIEIPVLGLVNNTGPLATKFRNKSGNFVLGDTVLIGETAQVVPVNIVKFFRETWRNGKEIKYGSPEDKTRKKFATAQDAAKAGYAVDFDNVKPNRIEECGAIGYLVIAPAGDQSGEFYLRKGDFLFAQAKCSYQRGGFRNVWRKVFDHAHKKAMAAGLEVRSLDHAAIFNAAKGWSHVWTLSAESIAGQQNSWWEPRIAKGMALPDDVAEWIGANYGAAV